LVTICTAQWSLYFFVRELWNVFFMVGSTYLSTICNIWLIYVAVVKGAFVAELCTRIMAQLSCLSELKLCIYAYSRPSVVYLWCVYNLNVLIVVILLSYFA
jgi:hypothetical protein